MGSAVFLARSMHVLKCSRIFYDILPPPPEPTPSLLLAMDLK